MAGKQVIKIAATTNMRETLQSSVKGDSQGYSVLQHVPGQPAQGIPVLFKTYMVPRNNSETTHPQPQRRKYIMGINLC